ncbi:unnamed protein product [Amoebophrya sp. A120]|nr:unnamed protein product [Amoebophrya sp. A120]|eukprot:GSA120T00002403001.1
MLRVAGVALGMTAAKYAAKKAAEQKKKEGRLKEMLEQQGGSAMVYLVIGIADPDFVDWLAGEKTGASQLVAAFFTESEAKAFLIRQQERMALGLVDQGDGLRLEIDKVTMRLVPLSKADAANKKTFYGLRGTQYQLQELTGKYSPALVVEHLRRLDPLGVAVPPFERPATSYNEQAARASRQEFKRWLATQMAAPK